MAVVPVPGQWVDGLSWVSPGRPPRLLPEDELQDAVADISDSAVDWALATGSDVAAIVGRYVPQLAQGNLADVLPASMQRSVLAVLRGIKLGHVVHAVESAADREILQVCVRSGIELTSVFAAVRRGQGVMVERLMQQCRALVDLSDQYTQYQLIAELSFSHVDALAARFAELYDEERRRWLNDPLAARLILLNQVLAGDDTVLEHCAQTLRFDVEYRHHLAVCAWRESATATATANDDVQAVALEYLRANGATQTLVLPDPTAPFTVWGNARGPLRSPLVDAHTHDGICLVVGTPGDGVSGFRDTTRDARRAATMVQSLPDLRRRTVHFRDIALVSLLCTDPAEARQFVHRELGALANPDEGTERLRETLEAYLDCHSPLTVAQHLFVARNTVAYRLRKAAEQLGRPIDERQPELRAALLLARALRASLH